MATEKIDPTKDTPAQREPPQPIHWVIDPTDPADHLARWKEFGTWAEWFLCHWEIDETVIPPCWALHGAMVEELTALWSAWQGAYTPTASPSAPAHWHETMGKAIGRLGALESAKRCSRNDLHKPGSPRSSPAFPPSPDYVAHLGLPSDLSAQGD